MGFFAECKNCKKTEHYDSSEIVNTGTFFHPIWTITCINCGSIISHDAGKRKNLDNARILDKKEGIIIQPNPPNGKTRAKAGDIREYWIQGYIQENYSKLGISKLHGPYDIGPDFRGIYENKDCFIEAERSCKNYIEHRHHEDERFKDVNVLIVLTPNEPREDIKKKLPKNIIYIDIDDFIEWWRPQAKEYALTKKPLAIIKLVAGEIQRRFMANCDEKDREMITCPDCDLCPYFGEGIGYEANNMFQELALQFLARYPFHIPSSDFKLTDIKPSEIDKFYKENIFGYLLGGN